MPARFLTRLLLAVLGAAVPGAAETPRLVLQITVDQLRGDMLPRHRDRFGPGGFRRLLDQGIVFTGAHHAAANTLTASGHAVLVTGAATAAHGIVANDWHDPASGRSVYCVEDERFPLVGGPGRGRSPHRLTSSTLGDEIVAGSGGRARAFAVAAKDRAAIIPAGRSGRALWLSDATGGFVSSTFYYQDGLPAWVEEWNARRVFTRYRDAVWRPLRPGNTTAAEADPANLHARFPGELRRVFPHPLTARSHAVLLASLAYTPFSDELVADFAATLLEREGLGHADFPDYLSVSLSATDYIGHAWGPESAEYVDNLARLDATLTRLFEAADRAVGAGRWLVVLSADHGWTTSRNRALPRAGPPAASTRRRCSPPPTPRCGPNCASRPTLSRRSSRPASIWRTSASARSVWIPRWWRSAWRLTSADSPE
ncbi:MAG: alkaline phosphatase family protein [Opitutaceae bacterium]